MQPPSSWEWMWLHAYESARSRLPGGSLDCEAAEEAARSLRSTCSLHDICSALEPPIAIAGSASTLEPPPRGFRVAAAEGAVARLLKWGVKPTVIHSDLDAPLLELAEAKPRVLVLRAHGGNLWAWRGPAQLVASAAGCIAVTTQCPSIGLHLGGLTDGDSLLAILLLCTATGLVDAGELVLIGMDFSAPEGELSSPLQWSERRSGGWKIEVAESTTRALLAALTAAGWTLAGR